MGIKLVDVEGKGKSLLLFELTSVLVDITKDEKAIGNENVPRKEAAFGIRNCDKNENFINFFPVMAVLTFAN